MDEFWRGDELTWSGFELGDCEGFPVDSSTMVQLHTRSNNRYAVQGTMTIFTSSSPQYQAHMSTGWRNQEDNGLSYGVSVVGKSSDKIVTDQKIVVIHVRRGVGKRFKRGFYWVTMTSPSVIVILKVILFS